VILRFGQQQRQRPSEIKKCRRRQHLPPQPPTPFRPSKWPVTTVNCFVRADELLGAWDSDISFFEVVSLETEFWVGLCLFLTNFGKFPRTFLASF